MYLLFVEDDTDDQHLIQKVIREIDPEITFRFAGDGEEALEQLQVMEVLPDIIFLDINMPRMTGLEALAVLKEHEHYREIPTFILSTSGDKVSLSIARRLGAEGYIVKPLEYSKLRQCLLQALSIEYTLPKSLRPDQFLHLPLN